MIRYFLHEIINTIIMMLSPFLPSRWHNYSEWNRWITMKEGAGTVRQCVGIVFTLCITFIITTYIYYYYYYNYYQKQLYIIWAFNLCSSWKTERIFWLTILTCLTHLVNSMGEFEKESIKSDLAQSCPCREQGQFWAKASADLFIRSRTKAWMEIYLIKDYNLYTIRCLLISKFFVFDEREWWQKDVHSSTKWVKSESKDN